MFFACSCAIPSAKNQLTQTFLISKQCLCFIGYLSPIIIGFRAGFDTISIRLRNNSGSMLLRICLKLLQNCVLLLAHAFDILKIFFSGILCGFENTVQLKRGFCYGTRVFDGYSLTMKF